MTETQFIVQMIVAYAQRFPDVSTENAMKMAATTYRQFISDAGIKFGDRAYAWDRAAARTVVSEYEP